MRAVVLSALALLVACDDVEPGVTPDVGPSPEVDAAPVDASQATVQFEQGDALCGNGLDDDGDGAPDCDDPGCAGATPCTINEPPPPGPAFIGRAREVVELGVEARPSCEPEGEGPYPCWTLGALPEPCSFPRFYEVDSLGTEHLICVEPEGPTYLWRAAGDAAWTPRPLEARVTRMGVVETPDGPKAVACGAGNGGASVRLDPYVWFLHDPSVRVPVRPVVYEDNRAPASVIDCGVTFSETGPQVAWLLSVRGLSQLVVTDSQAPGIWREVSVAENVDAQEAKVIAFGHDDRALAAITARNTCAVPCAAQPYPGRSWVWEMTGMDQAADLARTSSVHGHVWALDSGLGNGDLATLYGSFVDDGRTVFGYATRAEGVWHRREVVCGDQHLAVPIDAPDVEVVDGRALLPFGAHLDGGLRVLDLETLTFTRNDVLGASPHQVERLPDGRLAATIQHRDGTWGLAYSTACE